MTAAEFNAKQWAEAHEARDNERFGMIFRILAVAGMAIISLLGWSLQAQYAYAQKQLAAIEQIQAQLSKPHS